MCRRCRPSRCSRAIQRNGSALPITEAGLKLMVSAAISRAGYRGHLQRWLHGGKGIGEVLVHVTGKVLVA